ncbi:hypothetical protein [Alicyclobacillus sp.]|uniref:hypothetical protein n=1 Tax=Alicyclobacillus sp. TaxID=61169 RepID=UPI0025BFBD50|nr:hypothetical protein [Alicyclobacillus sp.]MCL6516762.1 hypothetical protein [Alicyclobacillus sp.]
MIGLAVGAAVLGVLFQGWQAVRYGDGPGAGAWTVWGMLALAAVAVSVVVQARWWPDANPLGWLAALFDGITSWIYLGWSA